MIGKHSVFVLVDNGSTHNFLCYTLVKKLSLPQVPNSHTYVVSLINRDDSNVWDKVVKKTLAGSARSHYAFRFSCYARD